MPPKKANQPTKKDQSSEPIPSDHSDLETDHDPNDQESSVLGGPKDGGSKKRSPEQRRKIAYDHLKNYLASTESMSFQSETVLALKDKLELVANEWMDFVEAQNELEKLATGDDAKNVLSDFFLKVRAIYYEYQLVVNKRIKTLDTMDASSSQNIPLAPINDKINTSNDTIIIEEDQVPIINKPSEKSHDKNDFTVNLKLEPIKIPTFDGKKENWVLFREQFLSLIHNNEEMSEALKMHQLYTHLSDNGLRAIRGITHAGANYQRAWKVLNERFNNNTMLVNYHLKRFFNLPILSKDEPTKLTILVDGTN